MILTSAFQDALIALIGIASGILLGLIIRTLVLSRLARASQHTATRVDDVVVAAIRTPVVLWTTLLALHFSLSFTAMSPQVVAAIHALIVALVIISISWTFAQVAGGLISQPSGVTAALPSARILSTGAKAIVISVGVLVALQTIGVSVAPVLTALGVGGLAVGLALQDTLANLFAGFHILASRQVRPGDFVQLSSGEQGFVEDISWRNTTIRQTSNNIVIVPNAQLAQATTVNYNLPDTPQVVVVEAGMSHEEDLKQVEYVSLEIARSVQRDVDGAVRDFQPLVRFHTIADARINFSVVMQATHVTNGGLLKHEFVQRLHERFRRDRITIASPRRVVYDQASPAPPPHAPAPSP